jgi:hypothetical protein
MISVIKFIIWIVGLIVVSAFVLNYFGYEINQNYFKESKTECEKRLSDCSKQYVEQGIKNAQCDFNCIDLKLIIKKK